MSMASCDHSANQEFLENALPPTRTVLIVGLGLLGTSLAMALKGRYPRILGYARKPEVWQWAVKEQVIDAGSSEIAPLLAEADLTVLCLPIPAICAKIREWRNDFKEGSIVTDIGSVKSVIVACGEENLLPRGVHFVGSHPMAGTEYSGHLAAFPELYDNAEVFVTPTPTTNPEATQRVTEFWNTLKIAQVREIDPRQHDNLVAHTSHISHLLALALTLTVLDCNDKNEEALRYSGCATGFRDTSRIASSSPVMWREIMENNQVAVLDAAKRFEQIYHELVEEIERGDFDSFETNFAHGKTLRDAWLAYKTPQNKKQG